jgi:hypothetical protein
MVLLLPKVASSSSFFVAKPLLVPGPESYGISSLYPRPKYPTDSPYYLTSTDALMSWIFEYGGRPKKKAHPQPLEAFAEKGPPHVQSMRKRDPSASLQETMIHRKLHWWIIAPSLVES